MDCPVCRIPLIVVERHGIELDHCIQCLGFWFDHDEIDLVPQALAIGPVFFTFRPLGPGECREAPRNCPRCRAPMEKVGLGGQPPSTVDRCPDGEGFWFDRGEFSRAIETGTSNDIPDGDRRVIAFLGETFRAAGSKVAGAAAEKTKEDAT
jgi:Zn-finger nucleic acid-binding protein